MVNTNNMANRPGIVKGASSISRNSRCGRIYLLDSGVDRKLPVTGVLRMGLLPKAEKVVKAEHSVKKIVMWL